MFGSGSLFGNTAAPTSTGGGLFGAQPTAPSAGGGLFGNTAAPSTGGGLFGNTSTAAPTSTGGGLFGNTAAPSTGGGLFGNTAAPSTGGGLFGNTQQAAPSTGGGLFGNTSTAAPSTGGGLFGNTQQPSTGGGLFGNTSTAAPSTGGGLFGNTQQQSTGGGIFGNTQPQQQQSTSLFSNTGSSSSLGLGSTASSSLFPSTSSTFLQPQQQQQQLQLQQQQQQQQRQNLSIIEQKLYDVIQSIQPDNINCRFLYWYYNYQQQQQPGQRLDPNSIPKPPNVTADQWTYALSNNPDPNCYIPVPAKSFEDLVNRRKKQQETLDYLHQNTQQILTSMRDFQNYLNFQIHSQLELMRKKQIELLHRYIEVWSNLEIHKSKGKPFSLTEEAISKKIQWLFDQVNQPNSIKSKVEEIINQVKIGSMEKEKIKYELSPEAIESLYLLLKNMTNSIERIANELEIAVKDAQILKNELGNFKQK